MERRDRGTRQQRCHLLGSSAEQENLRIRQRHFRMNEARPSNQQRGNVEAARPLDSVPADSSRSNNGYSITTKDLNLWYAKFQALINVTLQIKHGIITSLIGPSGCGKTTLLRCFNRVNERYGYVTTTGEIKLLGKNIYDPDVSLIELRKSVGMVFQRPNPLPLSIYENVVFGLRIHAEKKPSRSELDDAVEKAL